MIERYKKTGGISMPPPYDQWVPDNAKPILDESINKKIYTLPE
jgi:hypothetical protein